MIDYPDLTLTLTHPECALLLLILTDELEQRTTERVWRDMVTQLRAKIAENFYEAP